METKQKLDRISDIDQSCQAYMVKADPTDTEAICVVRCHKGNNGGVMFEHILTKAIEDEYDAMSCDFVYIAENDYAGPRYNHKYKIKATVDENSEEFFLYPVNIY